MVKMVNKNYKIGMAVREGTFIVILTFILGMLINSVIPITDPQVSMAASFIISWLATISVVFVYHRMIRRPLGSRRN